MATACTLSARGEEGAPVRVTIHKPDAYSKMLFGGSIGVGESYIDGDWDASDLTALTRLFVKNRDALTESTPGRRIS